MTDVTSDSPAESAARWLRGVVEQLDAVKTVGDRIVKDPKLISYAMIVRIRNGDGVLDPDLRNPVLLDELRALLDERDQHRAQIASYEKFIYDRAFEAGTYAREQAAMGRQAKADVDEEKCPYCPDGHKRPDRQPWSAWVTEARDGDGQPTTIHVARSNGAHVAESDAQWIRERLNDRSGQEPRT